MNDGTWWGRGRFFSCVLEVDERGLPGTYWKVCVFRGLNVLESKKGKHFFLRVEKVLVNVRGVQQCRKFTNLVWMDMLDDPNYLQLFLRL